MLTAAHEEPKPCRLPCYSTICDPPVTLICGSLILNLSPRGIQWTVAHVYKEEKIEASCILTDTQYLTTSTAFHATSRFASVHNSPSLKQTDKTQFISFNL